MCGLAACILRPPHRLQGDDIRTTFRPPSREILATGECSVSTRRRISTRLYAECILSRLGHELRSLRRIFRPPRPKKCEYHTLPRSHRDLRPDFDSPDAPPSLVEACAPYDAIGHAFAQASLVIPPSAQ